MIKIGTQERYLIIFALLLACVMILASAGLGVVKQNENESGIEAFTDESDDVSAESSEIPASTPIPGEDVPSSSINTSNE